MLLSVLMLATSAVSTAAPVCQNNQPKAADERKANSPRAQRLTELPPADLVRTVMRTENGCSTPVVVRYGVGQPPRQRR